MKRKPTIDYTKYETLIYIDDDGTKITIHKPIRTPEEQEQFNKEFQAYCQEIYDNWYYNQTSC